jgi:hypothetical protein
MQMTQSGGRPNRFRFHNAPLVFNSDSGEFSQDKDWDQFDTCATCRGSAQIDETPEGDLLCHVCKAVLPRPNS